MVNIKNILILRTSTVRSAITAIDSSQRLGVALVVDEESRLINAITDGDVRRGLLHGLTMESLVQQLLEIKQQMLRPQAVVARDDSSAEERVRLMQVNAIRQLPIVDAEGRVKDVVALYEMLAEGEQNLPISAVIMAGGMGKRLYPLTENLPKPMLPVGGRPLLEILVERLGQSGIKDIQVTTHYKPEKIIDYFGDGKFFGVNISYVNEITPLGTAGALGLLPRPQMDLLVVNGDILTQLAFSKMHCYHRQQNSILTMAVRSYEHVVPFGVVKIENSRIVSLEEKPSHSWFVCAGIYILSPKVFDYIVPNERLDMPDLIGRVMAANQSVVSFPIREKWIDIGRHSDYELANMEAGV